VTDTLREWEQDPSSSPGAAGPLAARDLLAGAAAHWPVAAMLLVAAVSSVSADLTVAGVAGLVVAAACYTVAVRWGTWRWLAVLAAVPPLLDQRLLPDVDGAGPFAVVLVALAVVALTWRAAPRPLAWGLALVAYVVGGLLAHGSGRLSSDVGLGGVPLPGRELSSVLALSLVVALAAVAGLVRAGYCTPLRLVTGVLLLVPAALPLSTGYLSLVALMWWPVAGAVGATALLRGARGRDAVGAQGDEIDEDALIRFQQRYGDRRLAPVAVVIAAYNEADGLPLVLRAMPTEVCGLPVDVVVVDDGSTDGTAEALAHSGVYVATCRANRGQGAALRLGYRIAREHGARYVITTDADGQYDAADLPTVLRPLLQDHADFVTGSRVLGAQHTHDRVRRVGVYVFAWLASVLTGKVLTDTSFGLRAIRAEVTQSVTLAQPQYQSSELLLGVISHGFRVHEVPATMNVRSSGSTKKGRNLVYGSNYARVMTGTWWREGAPRPATEVAPALRGANAVVSRRLLAPPPQPPRG